MSASEVYSRRRAALSARVSGPILLMGNAERARNLPSVPLPFRQDSNFLYLVGCRVPGAAAVLESGRCTLYLPDRHEDDDLWHGPEPSFAEIGRALGVDDVRPVSALAGDLRGRSARALAVADESRNVLSRQLCGVDALHFGVDHGDPELVLALIELRRVKSPDELGLLREAGAHTRDAHLAVMAATRPGVHERSLAALFEAVLAARACVPGYGTILSQRGEVLHNPHHTELLEAGRLLLLDGGGELTSGHGADVTRTWPVSGAFSPRQRAVYEAVLQAELDAIARCQPGVRYREVHLTAARVIARFLVDEGLARGSVDAVVESGAHALFFPHGVGHLLGIDVHDLENYGDLPAYPTDRGRAGQFGLSYLRLDLPLQPGWVVTVEPGFYIVPAILDRPRFREAFADLVDFERATTWVGFGGIRIEDDIHVTPDGPENLTPGIPRAVAEIEAAVGSGPFPAWFKA